MKLIPLGDKVVVRRDDADEMTKGGIVIPDVARRKTTRGKVLAVGDGRTLDNGTLVPLHVKDGDRVLFSTYAGNEVSLEGEDYLIMTGDDILAILK